MQILGKVLGYDTSFDVKVEGISSQGVLFWITANNGDITKKTEIRLTLNRDDIQRILLQMESNRSFNSERP